MRGEQSIVWYLECLGNTLQLALSILSLQMECMMASSPPRRWTWAMSWNSRRCPSPSFDHCVVDSNQIGDMFSLVVVQNNPMTVCIINPSPFKFALSTLSGQGLMSVLPHIHQLVRVKTVKPRFYTKSFLLCVKHNVNLMNKLGWLNVVNNSVE